MKKNTPMPAWKKGFLPVFILFIGLSGHSQAFTLANIDTLARYIIDLQYKSGSLPSYGAIRKSRSADVVVNGQSYFAVVPYFNHIACLGLLRSNTPGSYASARSWMIWYIRHIKANGQLFNHYYQADGTGETTCLNQADAIHCNQIDAEDSHPALFWILAYDYYEATNDRGFFTGSVKAKMEAAAKFLIDSLIMPDNLSIAKRSYAIKYTMDNSEVYKGLLSLSRIEAEIYGDAVRSVAYQLKANQIKNAVQTLLFNTNTGLYNHYLGGVTNSTKWYNYGMAATLWPQLFEIDDPDEVRSIKQRQVLNNNFDGSPNPDWTTRSFLGTVDAFTWASAGYVFSLAGDTARGYAQADYISKVFVSPFNNPPCYVADAGWAIMNMATKFPGSIVSNKRAGKQGANDLKLALNAGRLHKEKKAEQRTEIYKEVTLRQAQDKLLR